MPRTKQSESTRRPYPWDSQKPLSRRERQELDRLIASAPPKDVRLMMVGLLMFAEKRATDQA